MVTFIKLVESSVNKRIGNHKVVVGTTGDKFFHYDTCICESFNSSATFKVQNGGWDTQSTNRAIDAYRRYFIGIGFKEVVSQ